MSDFSVLVVDDEVDFVDSLLKRLQRKGVACDGALSGRNALEKIKTGCFNVVLLDMKLAGTDGNDVLREIKKLKPETQVVILSGYPSASDGREGMGYGAFDYLIKPLSFEALFGKLEEAWTSRNIRSQTGKATDNI